jgi:hypothetical protein
MLKLQKESIPNQTFNLLQRKMNNKFNLYEFVLLKTETNGHLCRMGYLNYKN